MREKIKNLSYSTFTTLERSLIETLGRKTFIEFKSPQNIDLLRRLLTKYNPSLELKMPNDDYIQKNVTDIEWILDGPGKELRYWSSKKRKELELIKKELLENEVILYHEGDDWSLVNLFDNNVKLWIHNMNYLINDDPIFVEELYENSDTITNERIIDVFFNDESSTEDLTYAQEAFLINILVDFDETKKIVSGTYGKGLQVEDEFIKLVTQKYGKDNVYVFSSKGGVIDMTGVDLCVFYEGRWQPVQVKSNKSEAEKNIPKDGFSVYKVNDKFFIKKDVPAKEF